MDGNILLKYRCFLSSQWGALQAVNRLKVVLVERDRTNKWLAEKLNKNTAAVSGWCTNEMQPSLETLVKTAETLNVDVRELLQNTINQLNYQNNA